MMVCVRDLALYDIDELRLSRGADYILPNGVKIKCPLLGDICDYGEKEYLSMISVFTATPIDRCAQLDDMGIDYTKINDFELFILFAGMLTPDGTKLDKHKSISTRILFEDLDFSKFRFVYDDNELYIINSDNIVFNKSTFEIMSAYIRKMHGIPPPLYTKVTNEFAKKQLILDAKNDADFQRKLSAFKGEHSQYQPYISALVNHPNFKYNWHTVWTLNVYAFFDSLKRISMIDNANHLYTGLYSGCIEYNKIKKELNWLKPLD